MERECHFVLSVCVSSSTSYCTVYSQISNGYRKFVIGYRCSMRKERFIYLINFQRKA